MEKSEYFVLCPKYGTECDISACPRFLDQVEIKIYGNSRVASGWCFAHGTHYVSGVPNEFIKDRAETAIMKFVEDDAHAEQAHLARIKERLEQDSFLVAFDVANARTAETGEELFDAVASFLRDELEDIAQGKIQQPKVCNTWQSVLPEMLTFPSSTELYRLEDNVEEHPETYTAKLPDGTEEHVGFCYEPHRLEPRLRTVQKLVRIYLEKALALAREKGSSSADMWLHALGLYGRVEDAWTMPQSKALLEEMSRTMIDAATRLALDLRNPDLTRVVHDQVTAQAVVETLKPHFEQANKSIAGIQKDVSWIRSAFATVFKNLGKWFLPRKDVKREDVESAFRNVKRYDCLSRVKEPHRSQIKAVIDYTLNHPIVFTKDRKFDKGSLSLSEAVQIVFNQNIAKWELVPGAWVDFESLKVACYEYRGKDNDPYNYAK